MQRQAPPYVCHLFVCGNDRHGTRPSCADAGAGPALKDALKAGVEVRGWAGRVRVSQSGCQGLCACGPNVMLHPQGLWFNGATPADAGAILECVKEYLSSP